MPGSVLSLLAAALASLAALVGLLVPGVYRDSGVILAGWYYNDAVTLLVAVPTFLLARKRALGGSRRARLVWIGCLHYLLYNDAFYLLGATLNPLLLVYAAVFALSLWSLLLAVPAVDVPTLAARLSPQAPVRRVASWMLFVATGLSATWIGQWLVALLRTTPPGRFDATPDFIRLVSAMDLCFMVGFLAPGAVWLWKRKPWGIFLGAVMNTSGALYNVVLAAGTVAQVRAGLGGAWAMIGLWVFLGVGGAVAAAALLQRVER